MIQDRLLDIAIREFSEKGLDGASTRGIAGAAGTAMSSITYHYGGKEGLYLAVADHIAAQMCQDMLPVLKLEDIAPLHDPQAARARISEILTAFAEKMLGEKSADWSLFIVREQLHPGKAFDRLYDGMMGTVLDHLAELVAVVTSGVSRETARITAFLLAAQVFSLRSSRGALLRVTGRTVIDAAFVEILKHRIVTSTDAILDRLIAERQETA